MDGNGIATPVRPFSLKTRKPPNRMGAGDTIEARAAAVREASPVTTTVERAATTEWHPAFPSS
jgi:hypothetical protein